MTAQTTLGTTIGRHRIARLLGGGRAGRVFACKSPESEPLVAIKMLRTKYTALGEGLLRQRASLERIESPHVARILDVAVFNNVVYVVMELVEGESLAERLTKGMVRTIDALALARAVVLGLQAGWAHGVAHGDLRPANILLPRGEIANAKLVDFQLAIPVEGTEAVRGAPEYLAPELLVGTPGDALTDLYALGCVMHEVLTGKPPFVGGPAAVLQAHATTPPPSLAATMPGAPQGLVDLVDRLLEKDRSKRLKTHGEALAGIERALAGQGMAAPRGPDIPDYDLEVDYSFDMERTDEIHTTPARDRSEQSDPNVTPSNPRPIAKRPAAAPLAVPLAPLAPRAPSAPPIDGVGVYRSTPTRVDEVEERTEVKPGIAQQPIPSADDLGLVLTPIEPKKS